MSLDEVILIEEASVRQRAIASQIDARPIVGTIMAALSKDGQKACARLEAQIEKESVNGLQRNLEIYGDQIS